jgi:hypothetical protein
MSTIPFSYHLFHKPTKMHYYGIRFAKNCAPTDLWSTYFSSSPIVKALIDKYGVNSFTAEVRKIFTDGASALRWENKVLRRLNAASRTDWINRHNGGGLNFLSPKNPSQKVLDLLRWHASQPKSEEWKQKQSRTALAREEKKRLSGWKMPADDVKRRADAKRGIPRTPEMVAKMRASKRGTKRKYLPDGTFIMVKNQQDQ